MSNRFDQFAADARRGVMEFHVENSITENRLRLYMVAQDPADRVRSVMLPPTFENIEEGSHIQPALRLTHEEAQALMDELWRNAVRPTEQGSPGQLKATERHLEDMQAIAIGLLRRDGVEL